MRRRRLYMILLVMTAVILLSVIYFQAKLIKLRARPIADQKYIEYTESASISTSIPVSIHRPIPPGACNAYSELRDVNFLHKSVKSTICKGVTAYSLISGAYPLCELQQQLPRLLTDPVKEGSLMSYVQSPVTKRNLSCFVYAGPDLISTKIIQSHIFEESNVGRMQRIIQTLNSRSPVTFVDIGSNIGVFTLTALDAGVPVVALDANIRNLMRLKLSGESLQMSHKLRLLWNFVGSQVSLMYLHFPQDCNAGGATKLSRAITDTIPVMSTSADSIASAIGTPTVVIKVDIEGGEAEFFRSAVNLFRNFTIPVVHVEWLQWHMTEVERQFMVNFFLSRRYSPRSILDLSKRINIANPGHSCDDLVWIREDFIENDTFILQDDLPSRG